MYLFMYFTFYRLTINHTVKIVRKYIENKQNLGYWRELCLRNS